MMIAATGQFILAISDADTNTTAATKRTAEMVLSDSSIYPDNTDGTDDYLIDHTRRQPITTKNWENHDCQQWLKTRIASHKSVRSQEHRHNIFIYLGFRWMRAEYTLSTHREKCLLSWIPCSQMFQASCQALQSKYPLQYYCRQKPANMLENAEKECKTVSIMVKMSTTI